MESGRFHLRFGAAAVAAAAVWLVGLGAAGQASAFGELTYRECIANTTTDGCGVLPGTILSGARATAVSPDGTSVYVVSATSNTIAHFLRNPDGSLTFKDCVSSSALAGCDAITGPPGPMVSPQDVAVSPDGKSVYVVSRTSNSLVYFSRAADGSLEEQKCISDGGFFGCSRAKTGATPLTYAYSIAITPDGSSLYVGAGMANAIDHFTLNAAGSPAFADCIADDNSDGCTDLPQNLLDGVSDVSVSPDGKNLYAGTASFSLSHFTIGAGGALTYSDCANQNGINGCLNAGSAMKVPIAVAAAPGGFTYVVALGSNAIDEMALDGNKKMSFAGCLADTTADGCADIPGAPLFAPTSVNLSPDAESVYVTSMGTDNPPLSTLTHFLADGAGRLTFESCQGSDAYGPCLDLPGAPVNGISDAVVSPAGDSLYAVGGKSNSISHFQRNARPVIRDVTPPETSIDSGPKKKAKRRVARFEFSSSEAGVTFSCTVDKGAAEACNSPLTVRVKKKPKRHSLSVTATDASGNADATPATFSWKVKAKKKHHKHHGHHGHH